MEASRKRPVPRHTAGKKALTGSDVKLLLCVAIFFASVLLKYADFDAARMVRTQAAALLRGGTDAGEVLEVIGHAAEQDGLLAVFDEVGLPAELEKPLKTQPQAVQGAQGEDPGAQVQAASAPVEDVPQYAEGGYSEDLEDREQTTFPKTSDETAYIMKFDHVTPTEGTLSSDYGARVHPISGKQSFHYGLDIAAPEGTPIGALADGVVRETGNGSYGNFLIVDHEDGFSTLYAHCSKLIAKKGDSVQAGQEIAQVGATGNATGNHLHLEVWRGGKALDPKHYVAY